MRVLDPVDEIDWADAEVPAIHECGKLVSLNFTGSKWKTPGESGSPGSRFWIGWNADWLEVKAQSKLHTSVG